MSETPSSARAVAAALAGNVLITVAKFVAAFVSGSGAMLSEAIHSTADAGNQVLLFVGLKRAARASDPEFPYGFGAERFVFGILSAAGIFFIGCGVTVYHGVHGLLHPKVPDIGLVTWVVLGLSLLIEGWSMSVALRTALQAKGARPLFDYLRCDADPATLAILLEDGAAILGLFLAALGIVASKLTGSGVWDAAASTAVGVLLGFIAFFLAQENRELLLGKSVAPELVDRFSHLVAHTPGIRHVHDIKTRQLTPETFKFKAEITLDEAYLAQKLAEAIPASGVPASGEERTRTLSALAAVAVTSVSDIIDEVEERVTREIPQARHIDLEVDHTEEKKARVAMSLSSERRTPA